MRYDGNLAYELDFEYGQKQREQKVQLHKQEAKAKAQAMARKQQRTIIICAVIFALCAGFMMSRNVAVYESGKLVASKQKELNALKEYSSQKAFELDKGIDIESIENYAKTKLDMVRPEKYQTVYVNIKQDDVTEITCREVEGIGGLFGISGGESK